jgi:hypothetical protein
MKKVIIFILLAINSVFGVLYCILYTYHEIFGAPNTEKLLEMLHSPLSFDQITVLGLISVAITIVIFIILNKMTRNE